MSHGWHEDTIEGCLSHAESFAASAHRVLQSEHIATDMQTALASDLQNILEDIKRCIELDQDGSPDGPRPPYVQYLEGVVFVQLHQIQQLQKEVARHAASA